MNRPKFSVMMCVYGGDNPQYFRTALESVYNQTLPPDEVVLVVDGSVPEQTNIVISDFEKECGMRVFRLEKNMGHGVARRTGFSRCKYEYVAIADADDINAPDRFEKQIAILEENPDISAISSNCIHFLESPDNIINEELLPSEDASIKEYMKRRCPICQPSVILSKKAVEDAGGYLDWYHAEDYYLWIRMFLNGCRFANISESLVYMRTTEAQMNRRGGLKYFQSMGKLYFYMYKNGVIGFFDLAFNVLSRFLVQVLMPGKLRGFIRKKFL